MDTLKNLLLKIPISNDPETSFNQTAKHLLSNVCLVVNGHSFRLIEIEFYLYNDKHSDVFAHCYKYQKTNFKWYFHHASDKEHSYKGGTYKGLDLTCGSVNSYGGILIRAIQDNEGKIIEGPCRVVNKILELTKSANLLELVTIKMNNNIDADNAILQLKSANFNQETVFRCPRIGLTLKKSDNWSLRIQFISKLYRFMIFPKMIAKGKKMTTMIAINEHDCQILGKYFNLNESSIQKLKLSMSEFSNYDINSYKGKNLTDTERLELYFNHVVLFITAIPLKEKIKLKLKSTG